MSDKLTLDQLRVEDGPRITRSKKPPHIAHTRFATVADWVEVGESLGATKVVPHPPLPSDGPYAANIHLEPGTYLVFRLENEQ